MSRKTDIRPKSTRKDTDPTKPLIRPYVEPEEVSHVDRMHRVTYAQVLEEHVQKHSQTQKPYQSGDYQQMEYMFPDPISIEMPQFPQWQIPPAIRTRRVLPWLTGGDPRYSGNVFLDMVSVACYERCVYDEELGPVLGENTEFSPSDGDSFCVAFSRKRCDKTERVEKTYEVPVYEMRLQTGTIKTRMIPVGSSFGYVDKAPYAHYRTVYVGKETRSYTVDISKMYPGGGTLTHPIEKVVFVSGSGYVTRLVRWPPEDAIVCVTVRSWKEDVFGNRTAKFYVILGPREETRIPGELQSFMRKRFKPGAYCSITVYNACSCEADKGYAAPAWDEDESATMINPDEVAAVSVLNGCPPFQWSVSGTGFAMLTSETAGRTNYLIAGVDVCGTASITVTDNCGNSTDGDVRVTEGSWETQGRCAAVRGSSGGGWDCACGDWFDFTGCHTNDWVVWYDSNRFADYCGPLPSSHYYAGRDGLIYWGIHEDDLLNVCRKDAGDCEDSPNDWTAWDGDVEGKIPPNSPAYYNPILCPDIVCGEEDDYRKCPGDRVGVRWMKGLKWVC